MSNTTFRTVAGWPTIDKDPDATLDYAWDWSAWLAEAGDTIASHSVTGSGIAIGATSAASGVVTARISGGTAGATVLVTCSITTAGGQIDNRTIALQIVQR